MTPKVARLLVGLLVPLLLVVAAAIAIGRPDIPAATDFLSSPRPTHEGAVATTELLAWFGVFALSGIEAVDSLFPLGGRLSARRRRRRRSRALLATGLLVFAGGAIRHQAEPTPLCCGDLARATSLLR